MGCFLWPEGGWSGFRLEPRPDKQVIRGMIRLKKFKQLYRIQVV